MRWAGDMAFCAELYLDIANEDYMIVSVMRMHCAGLSSQPSALTTLGPHQSVPLDGVKVMTFDSFRT